MHGFGTKRPWLLKGERPKGGWWSPFEVRYSTFAAASAGRVAMEAAGDRNVQIQYKPVR